MSQPERLTLLITAFNEQDVLPMLHPRLCAQLQDLAADVDGRILYVDDGSTDATWSVMQQLAAQEPRVSVLRLSRNFGKEIALTAGLDFIDDGAVILLDADGQDPPELIPADTGDFRLLSPRALAGLRQLRERHRFMKGLFGWVGYKRIALPYRREPRLAGSSKFGFWKLWNFALEGITSFSTAPLRVATYLGLFTAAGAFGFAAWVIGKAALYGDRVAGWPTMMAAILFLGGVQLIALGLIGEYLGRLYMEAKQRPLYLVDTWQPANVAVSAPSASAGERHADRSTVAWGQVP